MVEKKKRTVAMFAIAVLALGAVACAIVLSLYNTRVDLIALHIQPGDDDEKIAISMVAHAHGRSIQVDEAACELAAGDALFSLRLSQSVRWASGAPRVAA